MSWPVQSRVESFTPPEGFDGVISRAFASLGDILTWCAALPAREKGLFYALKGQLSESELTALPPGFRLESVIGLQVAGLEGERHIVVVAAN